MKTPLCPKRLKKLIKDQPGLNSFDIQAYFDCDTSRYARAIRQLRDSWQPFEQSRSGRIHFYDPVYAYDHKIPLRVVTEISSTEYKRRAAERQKKHQAKKKAEVSIPDLINLWIARPIAQQLYTSGLAR